MAPAVTPGRAAFGFDNAGPAVAKCAGVFCYRPDVLEELRIRGVAPDARTDPALVREYLSDLYRYEIRQLKSRLLRREFPRGEYAGRVRELKLGYFLLGIPVDRWLIDDDSRTEPPDARP